VNDLAPEVVARNLLRDAQRPFFRYQEVIVSDTTVPAANWIPSQALPLRHTAAVHMAPSDTGSVARIDRIRAVEVSLRATDGRTGELSQEGSMRRLIHMPNAGQMQLRTCGDPPLFNSAVSIGQVAGDTRIEVTWDASVDEGSGEQDVVRYAIFRRIGGIADWGEPFFSIPAGKANYIYSDAAVTVGETYQYAVTAQDCTPSMSGLRVSSQLTVSP